MRRFLIVVLALLFAWFAFKNLVFTAMLGSNETEAVAPDYYYEEAWLMHPEEETPGGWESPWGVDVFVIAPPVHSPAPKGLISIDGEALKADFEQFMDESGLSASDLTIYAPAYRSPSPASKGQARRQAFETAATDVSAAMQRYLSSENRARAFVILAAPGSAPMLEKAIETISDDEDLRLRFGGVLVPEGRQAAVTGDLGPCSPALEACVTTHGFTAKPSGMRWFVPALPHPEVTFVASEDAVQAVEQRTDALSNWLELNAVKPAEPFDTWAADEVVDVAPIRRPNQDEDISGERGN